MAATSRARTALPALAAGLTAAVLGAACSVPAAAGETHRVSLKLTERLGVPRRAEPVTTGIPIPKGQLPDAANARILLGDKEIPAQFRAAGLWRPGESVKWLLVDFQADLPAKGSAEYVLEYGEGIAPAAEPAKPLLVAEKQDHIEIDTGAALIRVSKQHFSLFDGVSLAGGAELVVHDQLRTAPVGARVTGLKSLVTRAVPGEANRGRSHLIYVKGLNPADSDVYTLSFKTATAYEVAGAKSGPQGAGECRRDFTAANKGIAIPADAWLPYAPAQAGDTYTFATVPEGADLSTLAGTCGELEAGLVEKGPMRSVVQVRGGFGPGKHHALEYTARYHFYAGSSRVRLLFTLENNAHGGRTSTGNARNSEIGGVNCVFFDGLALDLLAGFAGAPAVRFLGDPAAGPVTHPVKASAALYQDSAGGEKWNRYRDPKFHPRPASYVSFRGYRVTFDGAEVARGERAAGCLDVSDGKTGLTVAVRDFWQSYPGRLAVRTRPGAAGLAVGLLPAEYAGHHPLRSGEHKTHELLFVFHDGESEEALAAGRAFSDPLRLEPSPEWFAATRALDALHPRDEANYAGYEVRNLSTIGEFPAGVKPGPSLLSRVEEHGMLGWMDYGDVPIDFEAPSGQWGMKYDLDYRMAVQYARTLHPEWWRLFAAAARHERDIDIHHQPHYPGLHYVRGGSWAHSLHNEPGHKNPHRNHNHFTKDLCFGARGLAAYHYMTGDWKAREACLELAENALAQYMSPQEKPDPAKSNRMGWRGDGCTLNRLLEGYFMTGEGKFLDRARWQVASCAFDGRPAEHKKTSLWSSVFYMMALWRYVETFPEDEAARKYLLAHIETLRKGCHPETGMYYTVTPHPDGSVTGERTVSHYNIMGADALAVGYLLTGEARYMETARRCFAYGVENACWKNGPPTYFHIHSANGATHGNLFMAADARLRTEGK